MIQHQMNGSSQLFLSNQSHEMMNQSQLLMNHSKMSRHLQNQPQMAIQLIHRMIAPPPMANRLKTTDKNYGQWSQPLKNPVKFANPNPNPNRQTYYQFGRPKHTTTWKATHQRKDTRRKPKAAILKAKRFNPKNRVNRLKAPRNTTSYLIHAKKSGGIAPMEASPFPMTPSVLPTPVFSPSRESLVEMAQDEWGIDGYGSMKGLIRLRSPGAHDVNLDNNYNEEEDNDERGSSGIDVGFERRLDHDLGRFEMVYRNGNVDYNCHNVLENRVDDQGTHIAQLEEQNLMLKEKVYVMEKEVDELRRRLLCLERQHQVVEDVVNECQNESEGESSPQVGQNHNEGEL